jgi:hypothetical protein
VLLAFGLCGNMIEGLATHSFELIMPNIDDCVSLMLYPYSPAKRPGVFYMTRGWMRSDKNAWNDYDRNLERFGEKKAKRILSAMLDSYHALNILDTGAYPICEIMEESTRRAEELKLKHGVQRGWTEWIEQLLTGPYDDKFLRFGPYETVSADIFKGVYACEAMKGDSNE